MSEKIYCCVTDNFFNLEEIEIGLRILPIGELYRNGALIGSKGYFDQGIRKYLNEFEQENPEKVKDINRGNIDADAKG